MYWKKWAPSVGHDRDSISTAVCQWFTRDLQREWVAVATADSKSATSWVWPYTDMFNCVMPALVLPKEKKEAERTGWNPREACFCLAMFKSVTFRWFTIYNIATCGFAIRHKNWQIILSLILDEINWFSRSQHVHTVSLQAHLFIFCCRFIAKQIVCYCVAALVYVFPAFSWPSVACGIVLKVYSTRGEDRNNHLHD